VRYDDIEYAAYYRPVSRWQTARSGDCCRLAQVEAIEISALQPVDTRHDCHADAEQSAGDLFLAEGFGEGAGGPRSADRGCALKARTEHNAVRR